MLRRCGWLTCCVCVQLQERVGELEQERDLLKDSNGKLLNR